MINKLTISNFLITALFSCTDQVEGNREGWKFQIPKTDSPPDLAVADVIKDVVNKDTDFAQDVEFIDTETTDFDTPELSVSDVKYSGLPTGAIRYALSGFDAEAEVCVFH